MAAVSCISGLNVALPARITARRSGAFPDRSACDARDFPALREPGILFFSWNGLPFPGANGVKWHFCR